MCSKSLMVNIFVVSEATSIAAYSNRLKEILQCISRAILLETSLYLKGRGTPGELMEKLKIEKMELFFFQSIISMHKNFVR